MNPLLDLFNDACRSPDGGSAARAGAICTYGFAIPTDEALDRIGMCSPAGVVEVGAGTGYWAHLLHSRNIAVDAFDLDPPPSPANPWFGGTEPWHLVQCADHTVAGEFPERTLLVVWPTKNDVWAAAAVEQYHAAGGDCVVFVGEVGGGGATGDEAFHARMGELGPCLQCAHGVLTSTCTCDIAPLWTRQGSVVLPHWPGYDDNVYIYARSHGVAGGRRNESAARRGTASRVTSRLQPWLQVQSS